MNKEQQILFEDIEMCLKRISDFLGVDGYREVRNYIERYENHLNSIKKEDDLKECIEKIVNYCRNRDCGEECKYYTDSNNVCKLHNPSAWEV